MCKSCFTSSPVGRNGIQMEIQPVREGIWEAVNLQSPAWPRIRL